MLSFPFPLLPRPDLLPHKAHIRDREHNHRQRQKPHQMRPDQKQALSQRQVTRHSSGQLIDRDHADRPHTGIQDRGNRFAIEIVRGQPVQILIPGIVLHYRLHRGGVLRREQSVCYNSRQKSHENSKEEPYRDHRKGGGCRVLAQHGEQYRQRQPESDINCGIDQEHKQPDQFFPARSDPGADQARRSDQDSHRENHNNDNRIASQEFPVDDSVPVDRLGDQAIQGSAVPFVIDGVEAQGKSHERPQQPDKGYEGGYGFAAGCK